MPHNLSLYRMALMHKSMHKVHAQELEEVTKNAQADGAKSKKVRRHLQQVKQNLRIDNERLEFLGDAVLGAVVADLLYFRYANKQEGFLTTLRSKLVRRDSLNKVAEQIGLDKLVLYDGRMTSAHNSYMSGNAFEAFVGAIYLDRGYDYCVRFLRDVVFARHVSIDEVAKTEENYKSRLIEWCQKYQLQVDFECVSQHMLSDRNTPKFGSRVTIEGIYCGQGEGFSKKESHQNAARQAYRHIRRDVAFVNTLMEARNNRRTANKVKS